MSAAVLHHRIRRVLSALLGAVALLELAGCLSVSLDVPGEPLTPEQLRARIETRQYAADFVERVARAADIIADGTEDAGMRANTLRWKIGASVASRRAAYRYEPQLALVDTWAFALQMDAFFRNGAGRALFGSQQQTALDAAGTLAREADALAARALDASVLADYRKVVIEYVAREPLNDLSFRRASIGPLWRATAVRDGSVPKTVDAGTEVRADASDRLDIYGQRVPDELRWRAELAYVESGFRPGDVSHALKQFEDELAKLGALARTQPELVMERIAAMQAELVRVADNFDRRWGQTIAMMNAELEATRTAVDGTIERERKALHGAISAERAALTADAARIGKELGPLLIDKVGEIANEVMLLAILLVLILIGLPFVAGFLVGRGLNRRSQAPPRSAGH